MVARLFNEKKSPIKSPESDFEASIKLPKLNQRIWRRQTLSVAYSRNWSQFTKSKVIIVEFSLVALANCITRFWLLSQLRRQWIQWMCVPTVYIYFECAIYKRCQSLLLINSKPFIEHQRIHIPASTRCLLRDSARQIARKVSVEKCEFSPSEKKIHVRMNVKTCTGVVQFNNTLWKAAAFYPHTNTRKSNWQEGTRIKKV